jgi:multiple sugar transport system permease protein
MKPRRWSALLAAIVAIVWTLLPLYWFLKLAFETIGEIASFPPYLFPPHPQPGAFFNILGLPYRTAQGIDLPASGQAGQIVLGIRNSLVVAAIVTVLTMIVVVPLAYVFARLEFAHKGKLLAAVLLAASLPPVSTLIPFYALYVQLDLVGTVQGLVIVTLTITVPFVTWMLIGFFRNLPPIERLARIDGFSRLHTLVFLLVPMARSGILVATIIAFLFSWNEYVYAQVLVTGSDAVTLPVALSGFLFQSPQPAHLAAALFLTVVPPLLVAFFLQRHIAEMNLVDPVR